MKLYYFHPSNGNFGDDLNAWLWPRLLGPSFFDEDADELLVGIGTLLNHRIPAASRTLVFGSGYGYGKKPAVDARWHFFCVRGPKTAAALGLPPDLAVTDPALLIRPHVAPWIKPVRGRVGYIPHCDSAENGDWASIAAAAGLHFIDPRWSVDRVVEELGQCERLVTEAMHGAIFADAMRVPWTAATAYAHISEFKWQDWCESLGLRYHAQPLPSVWNGDVEATLAQHAKNEIKRLLAKAGLAQAHWTPPPPRRSTRRVWEAAAEALRKAAAVSPMLSDDKMHDMRFEQLNERLKALKTYAKQP